MLHIPNRRILATPPPTTNNAMHRYMSRIRPMVRKKLVISHKTASCLLGLSLTAIGLWLLSPGVKQRKKLLSLSQFTPVTLSATDFVGTNSKLLSLTVPASKVPKNSLPEPIWSIYIKDGDLQIERPYTPLEGLGEDGKMKFWVKQYEYGEVGRWLHSKLPGDQIEIRGPEQTWEWKGGIWDKVIMISGGTGITPFFQLLHNTFVKKSSKLHEPTNFTLLHSYRSPDEMPPTGLLQDLATWSHQYPDSFSFRTYVSNLNGLDNLVGVTVGRICQADIERELRDSDLKLSKILFLVCGPEPMISDLAGPRGKNQSQGQVGGILGAIGCESYQVWKL